MDKKIYWGWNSVIFGIIVLGISSIMLTDYIGSVALNGSPSELQVFIPVVMGLFMVIVPIYYKIK